MTEFEHHDIDGLLKDVTLPEGDTEEHLLAIAQGKWELFKPSKAEAKVTKATLSERREKSGKQLMIPLRKGEVSLQNPLSIRRSS